jgi:hypothetical protein
MSLRVPTPHWGLAAAFAAALLCALSPQADARPKRRAKATTPVAEPAPTPSPLEQKADPKPTPKAEAAPPKKIKEQNFNFDGLGLNGRSRSPQLLYFLERANEELERASLEKRSFIPSMVKTVEEEAL